MGPVGSGIMSVIADAIGHRPLGQSCQPAPIGWGSDFSRHRVKILAVTSHDSRLGLDQLKHLFVQSVDARAPETAPPATGARSAVIIKLISSTLTEFGRALGGKGVH